MEVCCKTGSQGSHTSEDRSESETETSTDKITDSDTCFVQQKSEAGKLDNLCEDKPIVNSYKLEAKQSESALKSPAAYIHVIKRREIIESNKDSPSEYEEVVVAKDIVRDVTSTSIPVTEKATSSSSKKLQFTGSSAELGKRGSKNADELIDCLFGAAQRGDKDHFKRLLYANYDNIVNDIISSESSGKTVRNNIGDSNVNNALDADSNDLGGDSSEEDSKLVIEEIELTEINSKKCKSLIVLDESDKNSPELPAVEIKSCEALDEINPEKNTKEIRSELGANSVGKRKNSIDDKEAGTTSKAKGKSGSTIIKRLRIASDLTSVKVEDPLDQSTVKEKADISLEDPYKQIAEACVKSGSNDQDPLTTLETFPVKSEPVDPDQDTINETINDIILESSNTNQSKERKGKFGCQHCRRRFKKFVHVRQHQTTAHPVETCFKCEACAEAFSSLHDLKLHDKVHIDEDTLYCELCKKYYSSKAAIKRHSEFIHVVEKVRPFKCDICDFAFQCQWHLREHEKIHTGQRDHVCPVCNRAFHHLGSMNRHAKDVHGFDTNRGKFSKY